MTDVTQRPTPATGPSAPSGTGAGTGSTVRAEPALRPLAVSAVLAALAVAAGGLVLAIGLCVIGWLAAADGSLAGAARVGVTVWLAGNGAPPTIGAVRLGLVPLGAALLVVAAARSAGRWAVGTSAPATDRQAVGALAAFGAVYGSAAALLAMAAVPARVDVDPLRAGLVAGLLAAGGVAAGVARGRGWVARAASQVPERALAVLRGAIVGLATAVAMATVTVLGMLLAHGSDVVALGERLGPGLVGGVLLGLASVLVLPNAALWATGYLLGPGFSVGAGTTVSMSAVTVGTLPAYPPLAALPAPGDPHSWVALLLVLPLGAGAAAGVAAVRRCPAGGWWATAATGAGAGGLAGIALAVLMAVSGGAVGPGRLAETGPLPLAGLLAVAALGLGGIAGGCGARALVGWEPPSISRRWLRPPRLPRMPGWSGLSRLRGLTRWRHR